LRGFLLTSSVISSMVFFFGWFSFLLIPDLSRAWGSGISIYSFYPQNPWPYLCNVPLFLNVISHNLSTGSSLKILFYLSSKTEQLWFLPILTNGYPTKNKQIIKPLNDRPGCGAM
jgi:hypothetical protein